MNLWRQDKGQDACAAAFLRALEGAPRRPFRPPRSSRWRASASWQPSSCVNNEAPPVCPGTHRVRARLAEPGAGPALSHRREARPQSGAPAAGRDPRRRLLLREPDQGRARGPGRPCRGRDRRGALFRLVPARAARGAGLAPQSVQRRAGQRALAAMVANRRFRPRRGRHQGDLGGVALRLGPGPGAAGGARPAPGHDSAQCVADVLGAGQSAVSRSQLEVRAGSGDPRHAPGDGRAGAGAALLGGARADGAGPHAPAAHRADPGLRHRPGQ